LEKLTATFPVWQRGAAMLVGDGCMVEQSLELPLPKDVSDLIFMKVKSLVAACPLLFV
jgi:hypothetical protein